MSMIREFAVEPRAIADWSTFRYVMEKFGIPEGRVLSHLPKGWIKRLLSGVPDQMDRLRIEEFLKRNQSARVGPMGRPYDPNETWSDNVLIAHRVRPYAGVIVADEKDSRSAPVPFRTPSALDARFFVSEREMLVPCTANELVRPAEMLVATSAQVTLVDPYLSPSQSAYKQTLVVLLEILAQHKCEYLRLVSSVKATGMDRFDRHEFASWVREIVGNRGISIELLVLGSWRRERRLHPRYLLTETGGLRYERGFAADGKDLECDVSLLGASLHEELLVRYVDGKHGLEVALAFVVP